MNLRQAFPLLVAGCVLALVACSSSPTATASPTPSAGNLPQSGSTATPTTTASPKATTLDPCQLVTSSEASSLAGVSYGAGVPKTYPAGSTGCIYGYQTLNVLSVLVAQAASPDAAKAQWAQEQSAAQASLAQITGIASSFSVNVNDVSNVSGADMAAVGTANFPYAGHNFGMSVIYLIKGSIFFTFSDIVVDKAGPGASAMEAQAQTAIGRLP